MSGSTRTVIFTPEPNAFGTVSMTIEADDGQTQSQNASQTFQVVVDPVNDPPTAVPDTFFSVEGGASQVLSVLGNDTVAPDSGEIPQIIGLSATSLGGVVSVDDNGTPSNPGDDVLQYTPPSSGTGVDTFTYTINDGTVGSDATGPVSVIIGSVPTFEMSAALEVSPGTGSCLPGQACDIFDTWLPQVGASDSTVVLTATVTSGGVPVSFSGGDKIGRASGRERV